MSQIILNALIVILVAVPLIRDCRVNPVKRVFRYFTTQSNVLCAAASLAMIIALLAGKVPQAVILLKYVGTAAVTVTLLTVFFFLAPTMEGGLKMLLNGSSLFLHLVNPVLALLTHFIWEKPEGPFWIVLLGVLPVLLYGALYLYKVIVLPEDKGWEDFYGFNRNGKWRISIACMLAGGFLIGLVLWLV